MSYIAVEMIDRTVPSSWWKELVRHFVKTGDELELRCWREETDTLRAASRYGAPRAEGYEVSTRGTVTDAFLRELMDEEPADRSGYHAMTKYFTINVKTAARLFSSAHYGTEIYIENPLEADIAFVEELCRPFADSFSMSINNA